MRATELEEGKSRPPSRIFSSEVWPLNYSLVTGKRCWLCVLWCGYDWLTSIPEKQWEVSVHPHRPHSTDSATHRKMTLSLADRCSKTQKIRILPMAGRDPECQRTEMIKVCCLGFILEQFCVLRTDCPDCLLVCLSSLVGLPFPPPVA